MTVKLRQVVAKSFRVFFDGIYYSNLHRPMRAGIDADDEHEMDEAI